MSTDTFSVRVVTVALATVVVAGLGALVYLSSVDTAIPDALDRLIFTALGALGSLLARTGTTSDPQDVQVVNAEDDALPVEEIAPGKK